MSRALSALIGLRLGLLLSGAAIAQVPSAPAPSAQPQHVVLWHGSAGDDPAIERALRLELESRGMLMLTWSAPPPATAADEALSRSALERSSAEAVLWLSADPGRSLTWLRVLRRGANQAEQVPLSHAQAAIDSQLVAVAAASLIDQVLRAQPVPPPAVAPAEVAAAQPATTARATNEIPFSPVAPYRTSGTRYRSGHSPVHVFAPQPRWFAQLGASLSLALLVAGMETDKAPPESHVFDDEGVFRDDTAWVPDGDSSDVDGTASGTCEADGIATDPGETPTKWCARVENPGFVHVPAVRLAVGYWVLPKVSVAALYQWHIGIESDALLDSHLLGAQSEVVLAQSGARAFAFSLLGGATVGRTATPVIPPGQAPAGYVNAYSGPLGLHGGMRARVGLAGWGALFVSPTLGARFPEPQLTTDLEFGIELWF